MKKTNKEKGEQSFSNQNKISETKLLKGIIFFILLISMIFFIQFKVKSENITNTIDNTNTYREYNEVKFQPLQLKIGNDSKDYELLSMFSNIKDIKANIEKIEEQKQKILEEEKNNLIKNSIKKYISASSGLNIRNREWQIISTLPFNSEVTVLIENIAENKEWDIILYNDQYCYINNKSLSREKIVIKEKSDYKEVSQYNDFKGNKVYLGTFSSTAYCACSKCCGKWAGGNTASGTKPIQGRTIAVDPKVIPLGSKVIVNGRTYIAEDTGSAIKGKKIDIFYSSHSDALNWGRRNVEIYIIK